MRRWLRTSLAVLAALLLVTAGVGAGLGGAFLAAPAGEQTLVGGMLATARLPRAAARLAAGLPSVLAASPLDTTYGVKQPWRVGIQSGHWMIDQLPDEQHRLRGDTGALWRSIKEAGVNLRIARLVASDLRAAGVVVDLLPATVPVDYEADAFVAIHADGADSRASGWKIATPRRSSLASRILRDDIAAAYGPVTSLSEDRYGVTYNMRGYYAFSSTRYAHAVLAATPAAIIETGYLTSADDRKVIVDDPEKAAIGVAMGILAFLGERSRLPPTALVPLSYPPMVVATDEATVRFFPRDDERIAARLPAGTRVRPVDEQNGWYELTVQGNFRISGWMKGTDLATQGG